MKLALAPMATLSHEALRLLIHRYGDPDEYFSEMIHAPSFVAGGRFESWYVRTSPSPERMVWQLTGNSAESMARAAELLLPLGGLGIDLNMGCSAPDIAKTGAGIAWMSKPAGEVDDLVRSVRKVLDRCPEIRPRLSVKLRLGESDDYEWLLGFCRRLVDGGVERITLHPRTRREKYSRLPRHAIVARLAYDLAVPVFANGDVASPEDAMDLMRRFPCAGIMIGRGAVEKPWIFRDIRLEEAGATGQSCAADPEGVASVPTATSVPTAREAIDHLEVSRYFLDRLLECQPPEFILSRAHRFFFYYCGNFSFAHHIKMRIQNAKAPDEIRGLLEEYFAQVLGDRFRAGKGA